MDFYTAAKQTQANVSITENGNVGYKTTYHPLLDMNFKISSYRNKKDVDIVTDLNDIMASQDATYILKFLFMVRDVREGLGERNLFRVALKHLLTSYNFENKTEIVSDLIKNQVSKFGRYDDLFLFVGTDYEDLMVEAIRAQLKSDLAGMKEGKSISLLGKWMPSENASSPETKKLAKKLIKALGASSKEYRQLLSALRAYLKVTETYTSANKWNEIDYNEVPSKANLKYKDAFLKHDEERRRDYLAALRVGVDKDGKQVKINSSVNFPHEIVNKYAVVSGWTYRIRAYDETLEQLWKNLKNKEGLENTIVVRDGSGSMTCRIGDGSTCALDVSSALAIYCAERLKGTFKDKFITFSHNAKIIDLSGETSLQGKLKTTYAEGDCSDTNIEGVFNLILKTAVSHKMTQDEMPKQILIISDMEFNGGRFGADENVFETQAEKYARAGYDLPKLIFWNVNSRTNTIPVLQNKNGVILVSGFSVNTLNMVMTGQTDPFLALVEDLNNPLYKEIPLLKMINESSTKSGKVKSKAVIKPSWL